MSKPMPEHVHAVFKAYAAKIPPPSGGPNPADEAFENRARAWTRGLAQQIVFSTGDRSWGCKNAGGGRPQSKDAIAEQDGQVLYGYDTLFGVGTGNPSLNPRPVGEDITGQTFMPVEPFDHIGGQVPGNGGGEEPGDGELEDRVEKLEGQVRDLKAENVALRADLEQLRAAGAETADELRARIGRLEAKVGRLKVVGPTKGRFALGSHYHDVDLAVSDPQER